MNSKRFLLTATLLATAASLGAGRAAAQAPVCNNGGPYTFECSGQVTPVTLDGTGSYDPAGGPVTFFWFEECANGFFDDPTSPTPTFNVDLAGGCSTTCVVALRVFNAAGVMTACNTTVTVQDTSAPVITCPADLTEIWTSGPPTQTDPTLTGFATAGDCDPNPLITYTDSLDPGTAPGEPETIVTRTWTATDYCGNSSSCVQTITLLSPNQNLGGSLDLMSRSCPNDMDRTSQGIINVTVWGTATFNVSLINQATLRLLRADNVGIPVKRFIASTQAAGRPSPASSDPCACDSKINDGKLDLVMSFGAEQIVHDMALDLLPEGASTEIVLIGQLNNGQWFTLRDCVTVN